MSDSLIGSFILKLVFMKKIWKNFESSGCGSIKLIPEDEDDIWDLYNIILAGDQIEASTQRRVQKESGSDWSKNSSQRIWLNLAISVQDLNIDLSTSTLHANGQVTKENKFVKIGSYHTLHISPNEPLVIFKSFWDRLTLARLQESFQATNKSSMAAIVFDLGVAHLCSVTSSRTLLKQKIELPIPKKHNLSGSFRDKAIAKFYQLIYAGLLKDIDIGSSQVVLLASPGPYKDDLLAYILAQAAATQCKAILDNKSKFVTAHCYNGYMNALQELLNQPSIKAKLSNSKYFGESEALDEFFELMRTCPESTYYGYNHVLKAHKLGAISKLLIGSSLLRTLDVDERKKYNDLIESVKRKHGKVHLFTSSHESSQRLEQISGIAAILSYPVPESEIISEDEAN